MKNDRYWFTNSNTPQAEIHRELYHKSLSNTSKAYKVRSGCYYYRGFQIDYSGERGSEYKWAYREPNDIEFNFCKTKTECMKLKKN